MSNKDNLKTEPPIKNQTSISSPIFTHRTKNQILYIDLNSCFATIEQQSRPLLRYKPVAITNRLVNNSCIITASYEAKAKGVKVGTRRAEAITLCPGIIFIESEPSKYFYVHRKFRNILSDYSDKVTMKSIDEGLIDLSGAPISKSRSAKSIAQEIKTRLKEEIGCYMRCNVGIASNRFLAKLAAGLHKPDGLDEITENNLLSVYSTLKLLDLPGINTRLEKRLNSVGIFTPIDFYQASEETLVKMVFKSIDGHKWHQRLRGIEVDNVNYDIKTVGRQYVLESRQLTSEEVEKRLLHLSEDAGYRMRSKGLYARGVRIWAYYYDGSSQKEGHISQTAFNADKTIIAIVKQLYKRLHHGIRIIGVTLYKLQTDPPELSLFYREAQKIEHISQATDAINKRFGERSIHSAATLGTENVKAKVPFGSTRYFG